MKRSEIQQAIAWAREFLQENKLVLPMFASWTTAEWTARRKEAETIIRTMRDRHSPAERKRPSLRST